MHQKDPPSEVMLQKLEQSLLTYKFTVSVDICGKNLDLCKIPQQAEKAVFQHNRITRFPSVPASLIILNLASNKIQFIPDQCLLSAQSLRSLVLDDNLLDFLPSTLFSLACL
jgi:hypothetical protein